MLFDFDIDIVIPNLVAPIKRLPKYLAWLKSLATPIQQAWKNLFVDYKTGSIYIDFDIVATYQLYDTVIWTDGCVYEATHLDVNGLGASFSGVLPNDVNYWTKVNTIFIGLDERIKYNSQKLLFEYALNRFFRTTGIYIQNQITYTTPFLMGNSGDLSSTMPIDSQYQTNYLGNAYTYTNNAYDYTIYVPSVYYTSLGTDAEFIIRSFADNYNLAGMTYNVTTY